MREDPPNIESPLGDESSQQPDVNQQSVIDKTERTDVEAVADQPFNEPTVISGETNEANQVAPDEKESPADILHDQQIEAPKPELAQTEQSQPGTAPLTSDLPSDRTTAEKELGILPAGEILDFIKRKELIKDAVEENVQGCSYDLRIGTIFRDGRIIKGEQGAGDQVLLEPGEIISLFTLEELLLPNDITATAFAINALSSQGLLVLNPGHVDPGYHGPLTVRVINLRYTPKSIDLGTPIFTVIFQRLRETHGYEKNISRDDAEKKFNASDVEQNPKSLARLVMLGKDKPLMTGDEVDRRIREHWVSRIVLFASIVAAIFAVLATLRNQQPIVINPPAQKIEVTTPSPEPSLSPERPANSPSPASQPQNNPTRPRRNQNG